MAWLEATACAATLLSMGAQKRRPFALFTGAYMSLRLPRPGGLPTSTAVNMFGYATTSGRITVLSLLIPVVGTVGQTVKLLVAERA